MAFECKDCDLHATKRKCYVPGRGNLKAEVVFVQSYPSSRDGDCGLPLVKTDENELFENLLKDIGLTRADVFVTSLVRCSPPLDDKGATVPPSEAELEACRKYLDKELTHIKPKVVVTFGALAAKVFVNAKALGSVEGRVFDSADACGVSYALNGETKEVTRKGEKKTILFNKKDVFKVIPTYSPAAILRDLKYLPNTKRAFQLVKEVLSGKPLEKSYDYKYAHTEPEAFAMLTEILKRCATEERLFFDVETSGLNWYKLLAHPHVAQIISIAIGFKEYEVYGLILRERIRSPRVLKLLRDILSSEIAKSAHNGKFDLLMLRGDMGIRAKNYDFDTMLAAWQLNQGEKVDLGTLTAIYRPDLGRYWEDSHKYMDSRTGLLNCPDDLLLEYNCRDVDATATLYRILSPKLEEDGVDKCFHTITMPHQAEALEMEFIGAPLDVPALIELGKSKLKSLDESLSKLFELTGKHPEKLSSAELSLRGIKPEDYKPFNPGSGAQVAKILYGEMKLPVKKWTATKAPSVDEEALESMRGAAPFIDALLDYRGLKKQLSTTIGWERRKDGSEGIVEKDSSSALLAVVDANHRIHTSYNIHGTATGRLSSSGPNLQNIEKTREFRSLFRAKEGWVLGDCDYAALELRILGLLSKDKRLIEVFKEGLDLHSATGAGISGLTMADFEGVDYFPDPKDRSVFEHFEKKDEILAKYPKATPDQIFIRKNRAERKAGKIVNFGVVYGLSYSSLAEDLDISKDEAKNYLKMWEKTYPEAAAWMKWTVDDLKKNGFVTYSMGRRRYLPAIYSNEQALQSGAERQSVNTKCQGTGADCTSMAIIRVGKRLREELGSENARVIMEIHDQLVTEQKAEYADRVQQIVVEDMERQMPFLGSEIKLVAEYDSVQDLGQNLES